MNVVKPEKPQVPDFIIEKLRETLEAAENGTLTDVVMSMSRQRDLETDENFQGWWNLRGNYNDAIGQATRLVSFLVHEADG